MQWTLSKPNPLYTGILCISNKARGPKHTNSYKRTPSSRIPSKTELLCVNEGVRIKGVSL